MIWTQGQHKMLKVAFRFWRSNQMIRKEHRSQTNVHDVIRTKSLESRYQLYTGCSDWTRITLRVKRWNVTKLDYKLRIQLKSEQEALMDETIAMDFSGFEQNNPQEYCIYHFFVKEEDLQKMNKLLFDVILYRIQNKALGTNTITENRLLSINTSKKKETLSVPIRFQEGFDLPIESEILRETEIKFRNTTQLCDREEEFVTKRKVAIFDHMRKKLGLKNLLDQKNVPTIAVIGSGGGMRAVIGMCGAMTALKNKGILDATMYTSGLSGSAWYLLALFANDKQHKPEDLTDVFRRKLQKFNKLQFIELYFAWQYTKRSLRRAHVVPINFSFTDSFGFMLGNLLNEKQEDDFWSKQTDKLENGSIPLPLIAALHVRDANTVKEYHEWIELSPYEVFIPKYGAAVDMKKFGDSLFGGYCLSSTEETTIAFLQGMCGGGYAVLKNFKPSDVKWYMSWSGIKYRIAYLFNSLDNIFIGKVPNVLYGITGLIPHASNLEQEDVQNDSVDFHGQNMMLVDAGIAFNSPYPTVLHPSREVDVIISFDFSNRYADTEWPFGELELAAKWADEKNIPFPKLYPKLTTIKKEWEQGHYEEVYIFPGDNSPTIVHFVMINKSFRETGGNRHDFDILPHYSTLKFKYSEMEFDKLHSLIEHNVQANSERIVDCVREVIDRKQKETHSSK